MAVTYKGIHFYDITTTPTAGSAVKIVTHDVTVADGDTHLHVGDMIDGKAITKIVKIDNFTVTPTGGGSQVVYREGMQYELAGGTKLFIPGNMNAGLPSGTFNSYQVEPYDTELDSHFHTKYASELAISHLLCFFPGTLIATPAGERMIEELVPGDRVLTADGHAVAAKWICRQTVSTRFGPAERLMPVRFAPGSLGEGKRGFLSRSTPVPHGDLTVTADHAALLDGVLCEAGALVNGTTIARVPLSEFGERYTVYHLETDAHEVVLANGAPMETFVDNVSRRAFDNFAEFEEVHGEDPPEMQELPYPRASNARHLPARIKSRLGICTAEETGKVA